MEPGAHARPAQQRRLPTPISVAGRTTAQEAKSSLATSSAPLWGRGSYMGPFWVMGISPPAWLTLADDLSFSARLKEQVCVSI